MKAIGYRRNLPVDQPDALEDLDLPAPQPGPRDAVGIVEGLGAEVAGFQVGDRVFYAGSITRPGANSELHVVDERIAALAPSSLDDSQAAALPLTAITAWELLFDRLGVAQGGGAGQSLLVVGG
ncbi:MAG: zinc-binding alcohol dehydrogenase family protein, partial [Caulobacter sp.]|nr:zinc-binding alcohol dehydrogenase family protein [Vitreoscilla sp.]